MNFIYRILLLFRFFRKSDFAPIFILIVSIQGTVLISQSVVALVVEPAVIGRIRVYESMMSICVLVAGFGAPALALRELAFREHIDRRAQKLQEFVLLISFGALFALFVGFLAAMINAKWLGPLYYSLISSTILLLLVNLTRLTSSVAQGLLITRSVYAWAIIGSVIAASAQVIGAVANGEVGWIAGRLCGEIALLICLLLPLRKKMPAFQRHIGLDWKELIATMVRATVVNIGLILRIIADGAPILLLSGTINLFKLTTASADEVGHFGIASLLLTAAILPISVMTQRALPLLSGLSSIERDRYIYSFTKKMFLFGCAIALALSSLIALALRFVRNDQEIILLAAMALMSVVPIKAAASSIGTYMLARGSLKAPVWITLFELIVIMTTFVYAPQASPLWGATQSVIFGSAFSLIANIYILNRTKISLK